MGDRSSIEWTDATWNPVSGCSKVSQGCKHCYAERLFPRPYPGRKFTDLRVHPERLDQPLRWARPRRIFVNSMSDLFHEDVPDSFIDAVFGVMCMTPQHTYQILTKRPERMLKYFEIGNARVFYWALQACGVIQRMNACSSEDAASIAHDRGQRAFPLPNVWLGVSVENQETADERIPHLLATPAAVRFLSCEPLIGPVSFRWAPYYYRATGETYRRYLERVGSVDEFEALRKLSWVIVGGESGPRARPMHPDWARCLRDQCVAAGVPFFFKQWGEHAPWVDESRYTHGGKEKSPHSWVDRDTAAHGACWIIDDDGHWSNWTGDLPEDPNSRIAVMAPIGKKAAGRELDGRTWEEFPRCRT